MHRRPCVVRIRSCKVKRRSIRLTLIYLSVLIVLLCCGAGFLISVLLALVIFLILLFFMKIRGC